MQTRERLQGVMDFKSGTRTLCWELGYWAATVRRWYEEGLPKRVGIPESTPPDKTVTGEAIPSPEYDSPKDVDVSSYLGFDKGITRIPVEQWIFPRFRRTTVEETDTTVILVDELGIKQEVLKRGGSMPRFLGWPVSGRDDFERIKERFNPDDPGRFPKDWPRIVEEFHVRDYPIALGGRPVGFFGSLRDLMGFEGALTGYYDDPKLIKDILSFLTDFWISLWEKVLSKVTVDFALIWEDMSYKSGPLISPALFKEYMLPCYKKLTSFLRSHGVRIIFVDTDGNCTQLIPLFMEGGVTGIYPLEAQAGMNVAEVARDFSTLQLMGGIDKTKLASGKAAIDKELDEKIAPVLDRGGYIPFVDHLVPPDVPWESFVYYRNRLSQIIEKASR